MQLMKLTNEKLQALLKKVAELKAKKVTGLKIKKLKPREKYDDYSKKNQGIKNIFYQMLYFIENQMMMTKKEQNNI